MCKRFNCITKHIYIQNKIYFLSNLFPIQYYIFIVRVRSKFLFSYMDQWVSLIYTLLNKLRYGQIKNLLIWDIIEIYQLDEYMNARRISPLHMFFDYITNIENSLFRRRYKIILQIVFFHDCSFYMVLSNILYIDHSKI